MEPTKEHFPHILLYYFRKGKNAEHDFAKEWYDDKVLKETLVEFGLSNFIR